VGFSGSNKEVAGATVKMSFAAMKALSYVNDQKSHSLYTEVAAVESVMWQLNWYTLKPKKECKFIEVGNSVITSVTMW